MQILIMHNPTAGSGNPSSEKLLAEFLNAGFCATYQSTKHENYTKAFSGVHDLVVVAGGDGTIGKVVKCLVERDTPLSILPLGTANNIAKTFGLSYSLESLVKDLTKFKKVKFDVGSLQGPEGEIKFIEAVGMGLFPKMMEEYEEVVEGIEVSKENEVKMALQYLKAKIKDFPAQYWKIEVDGEVFEGNFLLVEIMNIKTVGPNLPLASEADPGDGVFDVVMIREEEREAFREYIDSYLKNESPAVDLTVKRGSEIKIYWNGCKIHLDDEIWPDEEKGEMQECVLSLSISPQPLQVLVP